VLLSAVPADAAPSKVERLSTELENVRDDLKSAGRAFDMAYWKLHESEVRFDNVNVEITQTEEELAHAQGLLSDRIELMYRSDTSDYMNVLLGSLTFEEMVTRLEFFQRIGQADADAISSVKELRTQLNEQRASLEQETASQATALAGLKARRDDLQGRFTAKQAEYDRVKRELDAARAAAGARSTGGSTSAVAGPNGMIFPVKE
jgi:peptidoglycan hydrolase CwlO-like protein